MTTFMFCKFYFSHKTPKTISELSVTFYRLLKLNIQEDKQKQINKVYKSSPVTSVLSVTMGADRILLFVGVLFSLVSLRDSRAITEIKIKTSCIPFSGTEGITGVWHELSLVTDALKCMSVLQFCSCVFLGTINQDEASKSLKGGFWCVIFSRIFLSFSSLQLNMKDVTSARCRPRWSPPHLTWVCLAQPGRSAGSCRWSAPLRSLTTPVRTTSTPATRTASLGRCWESARTTRCRPRTSAGRWCSPTQGQEGGGETTWTSSWTTTPLWDVLSTTSSLTTMLPSCSAARNVLTLCPDYIVYWTSYVPCNDTRK